MQKIFMMICIFLLCSLGNAAWQVIGPEGAHLHSLVVSPLDENVVYAVSTSDPSIVIRSIDGCVSWETVGSFPGYVLCMTIEEAGILYCGCFEKVYKSTDAGVTWTGATVESTYVNGLAVHPTMSSIIYGVGRKRLSSSENRMMFCKSTNSGLSWTATPAINGNAHGFGIAVDPSAPNTIYLSGRETISGTSYPRVIKSTDGGTTWSDVSGSIPPAGNYISVIAVHPTDSDIIYAPTRNEGIYRSTNGGGSWTQVSTFEGSMSIATTSADPGLVLIGSDVVVYKSTNAGGIWTTVDSGLRGRNNRGCAISSTNALNAYLGNNYGCFKSTNAGDDWIDANNGLYLGRITSLGIAPSSPSSIYTSFPEVGVFKSIDNGLSWVFNPTPLSCGEFCSMVVHNNDPNTVFGLEGKG
jgi:photosystem II stability/assembly factor-like uncharacterized protein